MAQQLKKKWTEEVTDWVPGFSSNFTLPSSSSSLPRKTEVLCATVCSRRRIHGKRCPGIFHHWTANVVPAYFTTVRQTLLRHVPQLYDKRCPGMFHNCTANVVPAYSTIVRQTLSRHTPQLYGKRCPACSTTVRQTLSRHIPLLYGKRCPSISHRCTANVVMAYSITIRQTLSRHIPPLYG